MPVTSLVLALPAAVRDPQPLLSTAGPLQVTPTTVAAAVGTFLVLAAFLSVTAYVAARNVLGDVDPGDALFVGPVMAVVSMVGVALDVFPPITVAAALVADLGMTERLYDVDRRTAAYVVFIHAVVTVILMAVVGGLIFIVGQAPTGGPPPTGSG